MKKSLVSLIAGLLCGFAVFTGCASTGTFFSDPSHQAIAKIAIQQATLRAIQADGDEKAEARAAAVVKIIDQAQDFLAETPDTVDGEITAAELDSVLELVLPDDLTSADRLLVAQLSGLIIAEVGASLPIDQQNLPVAELSAVLGWVREAAVLVAPAS